MIQDMEGAGDPKMPFQEEPILSFQILDSGISKCKSYLLRKKLLTFLRFWAVLAIL